MLTRAEEVEATEVIEEADRTESDELSESDKDSAQQEEEPEQLTAVSVSVKSRRSDYVLKLCAAPSKKRKGLYNFSVHLGSKFLGYVEVKRTDISDLCKKLEMLK